MSVARGQRLLAALLIGLVAGCQEEAAPEYRPPQVVDSGGVRTTTVFAPLRGRVTVPSTGSRSFAEIDGYPLYRVIDVLPLQGPGIVVVTSREAFFLDDDLSPIATIDRTGEGPGEFGRLAAATTDGAAAWMLDIDNHRLVRVTVEGVDSTRDLPPLHLVPRLGSRPSGILIEAIPAESPPTSLGELWRPRTELLEVGEGAEPMVVTELQGEEVVSLMSQGRTVSAIPLLPHTSDWGTLADGSLIILESSIAGFTIYDVGGVRVHQISVRGSWNDGAPAAEEREARLSVARTRSARRMIEELPDQVSMPVYDRLEIATDSLVWLRRARGRIASLVASKQGDEWHVFSPGGEFLTEILLPPRFQLLLAQRGQLIGVWRNEMGVEHLWSLPLPTASQ